MSANLNLTNASTRKRILLIAANPATSATTGWPVGFWWAELTHPYWAFTEAGYEVEIAARGGRAPGRRLQRSGGRERVLGPRHPEPRLQEVPDARRAPGEHASIDDVDPAGYDARLSTGGQSPMYTFRGNATLETLGRAILRGRAR